MLLVALIVANGLNIAADLVAIGSGMQLLHAGPTWHTFVPHVELTKSYLALLVAVLGTTISPYLFFWQSAHRLEEMREEPEGGPRALPLRRQSPARAQRKQRTSRLDVFVGMTFSNLVMFAIIVATAQTLHAHNKTNIQSADYVNAKADSRSPFTRSVSRRSSRWSRSGWRHRHRWPTPGTCPRPGRCRRSCKSPCRC